MVIGLRGYVAGSALYSDLRGLLCGSRVQEFITKWRSGVSQLRSAHYPLIIREVIELFLERLPTSVPFQILRHKVMERIDFIRDDDITEFIRITNEALDIDNLYRRSNPPRSTMNPAPRSSSSLPRVPLATSSSSAPAVVSPAVVPTPRSKLLCVNSQLWFDWSYYRHLFQGWWWFGGSARFVPGQTQGRSSSSCSI